MRVICTADHRFIRDSSDHGSMLTFDVFMYSNCRLIDGTASLGERHVPSPVGAECGIVADAHNAPDPCRLNRNQWDQ